MLKIRSLDVAYGGLKALSDVSLDVEEGQLVAVVGPNGAGKTTLFKTISGVVTPIAGEIAYKGRSLLTVAPDERAKLGIAHVPEGRQVFASMTVMENLEMGAYARRGRVRWSDLMPSIMEIFPILAERRGQLAGTLSGGEQQMLAIGRGLAAAPDLLMLDEPSMGLAPTIIDAIFNRIEYIRRTQGLTILLVEQRVAEALELCDRGYVLETGRTILQGSHDVLMSSAEVRRAYLGS
ncbi:MAG TPA: ABC transporter ATP-binding protein [Steroidobacteraceae bacterium]|nr:ABC transporter ATP-binding protein [Steroidobacteraceae bacterium]